MVTGVQTCALPIYLIFFLVVSKKVDKIKEQQEKILDKVIGVTTNTLDGSYEFSYKKNRRKWL